MSQRILVVEDEPEVLAVCRTLCDPSRYELVLASNLEAARLWLEGARRLDLAVVDAGLGNGQGTAFCRELKAARPALPVVVLARVAEQAEEAGRAGADAALLKPLTPEALESVLSEFLGGVQAAGGAPRILHPTDFSPGAELARQEAVRLARALGGELTLLHVVEEPLVYGGAPGSDALERFVDERRSWASRMLDARALEAREAGLAARPVVMRGRPPEAIVQVAAQMGARLIVMGAGRPEGLARHLLGNVADRVIRTAPCPVVTVKPR